MQIYNKLWFNIRNELENTFNEETYLDVFGPLDKTHKFQNGYLYIVVGSEFIKNRINRLYLPKINELASKFYHEPIKFKFVTERDLVPESETLVGPELKLDLKYRP